MKAWNTPRIEIERFEANEYISACYVITCLRRQDAYMYEYGSHDYDPENGYILEQGSSIMVENGQGQSSGDFIEDKFPEGLSENDIIKWYTTNNGNLVYHEGVVGLARNPNHS